jgi:rfaE bifunctional protein kinase chain/domain
VTGERPPLEDGGRLAGPSRARAREILERAGGARVLVVGDLMIDRYIAGRVERISPEAPVPVLRVEGEETRLGGAGNVAANIAALGARCELVGCSGEDEGHELLLHALAAIGIDGEGVVPTADRPTTVKTRLVARSQQVARFDRETSAPVPEFVEAELLERIEARLGTVDAVALEDYNKGVLTLGLIRRVVEAARERNLPVVVDPKRHHFFEFAGTTVFKPNLRELEDAMGAPPAVSSHRWLEEVRVRTGAEYLLLTLGEGGMVLHGPRTPGWRLPATARSVYDVSGAGDTVTAVMSVALAVGASPGEGAVLANVAAGVGVGKAGVVPVGPGEILHELARPAGPGRDSLREGHAFPPGAAPPGAGDPSPGPGPAPLPASPPGPTHPSTERTSE